MCSSDGSAGIMIPYGCVCYNGTTPGAQHFAVPSCMEDTHQLSNGSSLYRECLSNGKWSGAVARCEPIIPCEFNAVTQYQLQNNVCGLVFSLSIRFLSLKCNVHACRYCNLFSHIVPSWVIAVIICAVVLSFAIGIIVGILLTHFCGICVHGIQQGKSIINQPYRLVHACIYMNLYTHCV